MNARKFQYQDVGKWFALYIPLALAAFFTTYFLRIAEPMPLVVHLHFVLMVLWLGMLIAQPLLIKHKKLPVHRMVGKISYVLVPLLLFTAYVLTRNEYMRTMDALEKEVLSGVQSYAPADMEKKAASSPIALLYLVWFFLFYVLAIVYSRNAGRHARFMVAAALTLTGPTVDRILGIHFGINSIAGVSAYLVSFILIDALLGWLLWLDWRHKRDVRALSVCLLLYVAGQVFYLVCPLLGWWPLVMKRLMLG